MIYRCNYTTLTASGDLHKCDAPATHFDSRALPQRHLFCEQHRASDDAPIRLLGIIGPGWNDAPSREPRSGS